MYQFRPVTDRMRTMYEAIRERIYHVDPERSLIVTEAHKKYEKVIPLLRYPMIFREMCEKMTLRVEDFEILVANNSKYFCGTIINPIWGGGETYLNPVDKGEWKMGDDGYYHNSATDELRMIMSQKDYDELNSVREYWKRRTFTSQADAWQPEGYDELANLAVRDFGKEAPLILMPPGHMTPGYSKILNTGYAAISKQAREWMDAHRNNLMGDDVERYIFYSSVEISCMGATTLLKRYGQTCFDKVKECSDIKRKAELTQMGENLMWISENPVRTFWQACQAALLYEMMISMAGVNDIGSFGRFDQYTWPFLKKDVEEGSITMDQAQEIVDCFFMKVNSFYNGGIGPLVPIIGIGNTYLHTTIGGVDPDTGEDASNPVTYMTLETLGRLSLHDPTVSLRVHKNTPDKLWECAITVNKLVGGLPLYQNDDVIVPGIMKELGFSLRDARDYALIGCQEITGSGNDYAAGSGISPPSGYLHYSSMFNMAINDGINPYNGERCPIHTGYLYDMKSIEEVKEAFTAVARYIVRAQVSIDNYLEYIFMNNMIFPIVSISVDGCMESGKDISCGGARYNSYGGTAVGLATIADSITAIKYMCFDNKKCTTRELYDAVMANWEGYESLRQIIINEAPHFGNANPYADMEMKWVTDTYYNVCKDCYSTRSKTYKAGMYSAANHVAQGYHTWATPDGRKAGMPIADAASPVQGRDRLGPTAVLQSALSYDHGKFMDGMALNVRIHPSVLDREDGIAKVRDMTKTYLNSGGMEIQYNIVSSDTMRAAQADPETYRDLVVRIAGFSAYFVELSLDCQNDLISRTENYL
ncbi:MAG: hypothetical protein GX654_06895 [Desulfatiglans sp.]|nr:hypothetical protein [Desulfatiglans sp.]